MVCEISASRLGKLNRLMCAAATALCLTFVSTGVALSMDNATAKKEGTAVSEASSQQESMKKMVVAKVNDAEITMDSLVKMMNRISAKDNSDANQEAVKRQALDRLILQHLAFQKAQQDGLAADEKNVIAAMENLKKNLGGAEEYKNFLAKEQVTEEELKTQISRSLTLEIAYAREVYNKVAVPEDAIKKQYEKEKANYVTPEKMRVVDVLFLKQDNAKALQKTAEEVLKKIKADKEQDPWKLTLDGTFIVRTYDINKSKDKELHKAGKKLKNGELSGIIKTPKELHIIKMKEYAPQRQMSLDEVRGNIENSLRVPAQDRRLKEWEQELRKEAKIEIIWPELAPKKP